QVVIFPDIILLGDGTQSGFSVSVGSIGFSSGTPVDPSGDELISPFTLKFRDVRPPKRAPEPPKPKPIKIPYDMMVAWIGPYELNQSDLTGPTRNQVRMWVEDLSNRQDCQELYAAIERPKKESVPIIEVTGAADGTGNDDINDPLGGKRADGVAHELAQ